MAFFAVPNFDPNTRKLDLRWWSQPGYCMLPSKPLLKHALMEVCRSKVEERQGNIVMIRSQGATTNVERLLLHRQRLRTLSLTVQDNGHVPKHSGHSLVLLPVKASIHRMRLPELSHRSLKLPFPAQKIAYTAESIRDTVMPVSMHTTIHTQRPLLHTQPIIQPPLLLENVAKLHAHGSHILRPLPWDTRRLKIALQAVPKPHT